MVNGPNLYAYCRNNPVNLVDPWGLETGSGAGSGGGKYNCGDGEPTNPDKDSQQVDPNDLDDQMEQYNELKDYFVKNGVRSCNNTFDMINYLSLWQGR